MLNVKCLVSGFIIVGMIVCSLIECAQKEDTTAGTSWSDIIVKRPPNSKRTGGPPVAGGGAVDNGQ